MKQFILASHGKFADGILNSLEIIIGKQENIETLCAYLNGETDIKSRVRECIEKHGHEDDIIVVTDLFGGSVNNEFMNYIHKDNVYLTAGLNLSLLVELIMNQDKPAAEMIKEAVESSKEMLVYCNDKASDKVKEEEF